MKRHILGWMALFILMFVPIWWTTTRVYRASLPFEEMSSPQDFKCKVGIELQYPPVMKYLENELQQYLQAAELDFTFGSGPNNYILNVECGKYSQVKVLVTSTRKVAISIPDADCTMDNARDIVLDTILDLFDSKVAEGDSINMLKSSETYQITWSLLNGDPRDSFLSWDVAQAVNGIFFRNFNNIDYFTPLQNAVSPLVSLEFTSQVLFQNFIM